MERCILSFERWQWWGEANIHPQTYSPSPSVSLKHAHACTQKSSWETMQMPTYFKSLQQQCDLGGLTAIKYSVYEVMGIAKKTHSGVSCNSMSASLLLTFQKDSLSLNYPPVSWKVQTEMLKSWQPTHHRQSSDAASQSGSDHDAAVGTDCRRCKHSTTSNLAFPHQTSFLQYGETVSQRERPNKVHTAQCCMQMMDKLRLVSMPRQVNPIEKLST